MTDRPDMPADPGPIAARLVQELMLVSVLVAGEGVGTIVAALEQEGASADTLAAGAPSQGYDLAILLAAPHAALLPATRHIVETLNMASERLLLAPLPLGRTLEAGHPALPELSQWFEVFAEFGYQPVVDFDASFVSPGAFLVDRAATADEGDLAAFSDRLQIGEAAARHDSVQDGGGAGGNRVPLPDTAALMASLAEAKAALARSQEAAAREAERHAVALADAARRFQESEARNTGWDGLRLWVRASAADTARDTVAALARDLPGLNALRSPAPPFVLPVRRRRFWGRAPAPSLAVLQLLADATLIRASGLFDAAWYIASAPDLAAHALDPVFHYLLVGTLRGADPGPWFDTAAYLAAHPGLEESGIYPLVHAIRTGVALEMRDGEA